MKFKVMREGAVKITKARIEAAWRGRKHGQRLVLGDQECRGLALVVGATSMTWRFDYKPRGLDPISGKRFSSRSITIGSPETHSPEDARAEANRHKGESKAGIDPADLRKAKIRAAAQSRGRTMQRLLTDYTNALPTRAKLRGQGKLSSRQINADISHATSAIISMKALDKPIEEITATELKVMLRACSDKPATARHRFGALGRLFDWAQDEGLVKSNPCLLLAKSRRPRPVAPRSTYHTPRQMAALWKAIEQTNEIHQVHRDLMQFLVAIPCRRGEATGMDWKNVNLADSTWSQPDRLTKNGDPHRLFLHPLALEILKRRYEAAGNPSRGLIFPAPKSGKPIDTFSDLKVAIDKHLQPQFDWINHDHRRSFVTAVGEAGVHEAIADSILNHRQAATRGGVLGVYQRAVRWPEQVKAMQIWGELLLAEISDDTSKKTSVVQLKGARQ